MSLGASEIEFGLFALEERVVEEGAEGEEGRDGGSGPFERGEALAPEGGDHGDDVGDEGPAVDHAHGRNEAGGVEPVFEGHGDEKKRQRGDTLDEGDISESLEH